ncbi:hypothetical protein BVRB_021550, partial [Beta vulgaris subsp. vulgaris]
VTWNKYVTEQSSRRVGATRIQTARKGKSSDRPNCRHHDDLRKLRRLSENCDEFRNTAQDSENSEDDLKAEMVFKNCDGFRKLRCCDGGLETAQFKSFSSHREEKSALALVARSSRSYRRGYLYKLFSPCSDHYRPLPLSNSYLTIIMVRMAGSISRLGMDKWWLACYRSNGLRIDTMSPYHTSHIKSFFHNFGHKVMHKVTDNFVDVAPGLVGAYAVYVWGNAEYDRENRKHWS